MSNEIQRFCVVFGWAKDSSCYLCYLSFAFLFKFEFVLGVLHRPPHLAKLLEFIDLFDESINDSYDSTRIICLRQVVIKIDLYRYKIAS